VTVPMDRKLKRKPFSYGLGAALAPARVMTSFVTFISSTDPAAFVAVTLLLVMIALWACYVPARRAMRVGSHGRSAA
jgi:ABC-type lipoprotein release transport system permease subunit